MMDRELIVTKKLCKLPRPPIHYIQIMTEQALGAAEQGANLQTLVKTSLNVATTEILLLPAAIRGRGVQMQLQIEMVIFIKF